MIINSVWCEHKPTNQPKMRGKGKQEKHVCVGGGGDAVSGRPWLISLQSSRSSSWRLFFCSQTTERRSQFFIFSSSSSSNVSIWLKTWLVRERVSECVRGRAKQHENERERKKKENSCGRSLCLFCCCQHDADAATARNPKENKKSHRRSSVFVPAQKQGQQKQPPPLSVVPRCTQKRITNYVNIKQNALLLDYSNNRWRQWRRLLFLYSFFKFLCRIIIVLLLAFRLSASFVCCSHFYKTRNKNLKGRDEMHHFSPERFSLIFDTNNRTRARDQLQSSAQSLLFLYFFFCV